MTWCASRHLRGDSLAQYIRSSGDTVNQRLPALCCLAMLVSCTGDKAEKADTTDSETEVTDTTGDTDTADPDTDEPELSDLTAGLDDDHWRYYFSNKTGGVKADSEIFIGIVGKNWGDESYCKVVIDTSTKVGVCEALVSSSSAPEPIVDLFYSLDQISHVDLPAVHSGRIFISVDDKLVIQKVNAGSYVGFVAPNMSDPNDPNIDFIFDFVEFTTGVASGNRNEAESPFWGNTTQVDAFSIPLVATLYSRDGSTSRVGIRTQEYSRDALFSEFYGDVPPDFAEAFTDLVDASIRVDNASKSSSLSQTGSLASAYFDSAIDDLFSETAPFELSVQNWGTCTGQAENNVLTFDCNGSIGRIARPTTEEVLLCSGELGKAGTYTGELDGVMQAQVCAAFHRGVVMQPEDWGDESRYYINEPYNYYSKYWHDRSHGNKAYGFAYDDVHDKATLMYSEAARVLVVEVHW